MKTFGVELHLLSPALLAASPPASNLTETLRHVPGNSLRGLLARRYLDAAGRPEDDAFQRLFVRGGAAFGDALPAGAEALPRSARTCKYHPGFTAQEGHGVVDLLLHAPGEPAACPRCQAPLDYAQGFWAPERREQVAVRTRLHTRTAIDPHRGTARTGQLFTQEVLAEGQRFAAEVEVPDDLAGTIERLLAGSFEGTVGTGGSRGQGWVKVQRREPAGRDPGSARDRLTAFTSRAGRPVLGVTLLSDAILRDEFLRFRTALTPADLRPLGIRPEDWSAEPEAAFLDTRTVFGFDGEPIRLPRQPRLAVRRGSSFLFPASSPAGDPQVPTGQGIGWIGEGRREGFGRAVLWHPFHLAQEGAPEGAGEEPHGGDPETKPPQEGDSP